MSERGRTDMEGRREEGASDRRQRREKRDEEQRDIKKGESHRCTKCTLYIFDAQKKRKLSMVR